MPCSMPVTIRLRSWLVLPSRTMFRTAYVAISTSNAATRPPPTFGQEPLRDDARSEPASCTRICACCSRGEHVDDPVDRLGGVVGVQGGEHEVAGLGDRERGGDRLGVPHLADEEHVGVFAEGRAQRPPERVVSMPDLALVHRRQLVGVHVLDRVLDRDDVARPLSLIASIIAARRGRLPRTGGTGDEDQALRQVD